MKHLQLKHILFLFFIGILNVSCLDNIASSILYQNDEANKIIVPEVPPQGLEKIDIIQNTKTRTVGWYYQHTKINAPVLIFFHGNASNIMGLYESGFIKKLIELEVHVIVFDYPKYGLSKGELNEKGVLNSSQKVLDFAKEKFPLSRIILWGRSLGCAPATITAAKNDDSVDSLILTSPWDSFWKLAKYKSGLSDSASKSAAKGNEYESEVFARVIDKPVLIHHGTKDETIPFFMGENLSKSFLSKDVAFIPIEGAGHNNLMGDKEWADIYRFVHLQF